MSDLIERDALYEVVCRLWDKSDSEDFEKGVFEIIKNAPTIEIPTWASVLAELHEQFFALEKEIRKASAEMSAVIREYVDRPKGEWMSEGRVYPPTNAYHSAYCSHCGEWNECLTDYCGNCGADMRGERADEHGQNKSTDRQ